MEDGYFSRSKASTPSYLQSTCAVVVWHLTHDHRSRRAAVYLYHYCYYYYNFYFPNQVEFLLHPFRNTQHNYPPHLAAEHNDIQPLARFIHNNLIKIHPKARNSTAHICLIARVA